ncbi:MAG: dicarboxylate/amino acid:cation symporter, partial [Planctomycetota bacterium]
PGLDGPSSGDSQAKMEDVKSLGDVIFEQIQALIPTNPVAAVTEGKFLSIIAFTVLIGVFALRVGGSPQRNLKIAAETGFEIVMSLTMFIIRLAPFGVFFLMADVTASQGVDVFWFLGKYVVTVAAALAFHAVITLPLILFFVAKRNPVDFVRSMAPALLTAFSSASSNGTLPITMSNITNRAGVRNRTGSFVLPLGATINMDGTALYEAIAVLFIAQMHRGENLPLDQQIIVALTALLASVGAAGIPHAGLVMMVIILQAVGLPLEMQGLILAVDRVLDMLRTSVNVWSDSCGCAVVDRFEEDDEEDADTAPDGLEPNANIDNAGATIESRKG